MSTSGLTNQYNPPTLDGLTVLEADQLYVGGQEIDITTLVPYTGANKTVDVGSNPIRTSYAPVIGNDVVNLTTLTNAVTYIDGANALTYLNKITSTPQTVAGDVTFNNTVSANYYYTDNSYNWGRLNASYNAWSIKRILNGSIIRDLQFRDETDSITTLLLSSSGQTVYVGLTCDYGTASKVPIWDSNKKLVSSGTDSIKISYLDNVGSDIQTQLNARALTTYVDSQDALRLLLTGGIMTGLLQMNGNKVQSSAVPTTGNDLTNKTYVDGIVAGAGYVLKTGDSMSGVLTVEATVNVSNRLLGLPDGSPGNFWIGLRGSGTETDRLAISIGGASTTGVVSGVTISKSLYLSPLTADRALYLDGSKVVTASSVTGTELGYLSGATSGLQGQINSRATFTYTDSQDALRMVKAGGNVITGNQTFSDNTASTVAVFDTSKNLKSSTVTTTELGYVGGVTSAIQTQINTKANTTALANYLPLAGGTLTGEISGTPLNRLRWGRYGDNRSTISPSLVPAEGSSWYFGTFENDNKSDYCDSLLFNGWSDSSGGNTNMIAFNKVNKGIRQFHQTYGSATKFSTWYDCVMTDANSANVTLLGQVGIGTGDPAGKLHVYGRVVVSDLKPYVFNDFTVIKSGDSGSMAICAGNEASNAYLYLGTPFSPTVSTGSAYKCAIIAKGLTQWSTSELHFCLNGATGSNDYTESAGLTHSKMMIKPNGNVGIGTITPFYKLDVLGDAYASGSLLFGSSGAYDTGCIYSDINWGCIIRAKQASPLFAIFELRDTNSASVMRINKDGVTALNGLASSYAVANNLTTRAGAVVVGGNNTNYDDSWNTGLLMECQDTTGISIHDSGSRVSSFMYYSGNCFYMGRNPGGGSWSLTPYTFESALTANNDFYYNNPPATSTYGSAGYGANLGWDVLTKQVTVNVIEFYHSGPYSNYFQGNWNGLNRTNQFYKSNVSQSVWISGYCTAFVSSPGSLDIVIRLYNQSTGQFFYNSSQRFTNVANHHTPINININFGTLPAGWYDTYVYWTWPSQNADNNDYLSLTYMLCHGINSP